MTLTPDEKKKMLEAKEFIKQKDFRRAYSLIEGIDHPTALKWRNQLESRLSDEDFGDPFADDEPKSRSLSSQPVDETKKRKGRKRLYIAIGVISVIVIMMMAAAANEYDSIVQEATALEVYPSVNSAAVNADGDQWDFDGDSLSIVTVAFNTASDAVSTPTVSDITRHATTLSIVCSDNGYGVGVVGDSSLTQIDNVHVAAIKFDDDPTQEITMLPTNSDVVAFFRDEDLPALFSELSQSGEMWITLPTATGLYRHSIYDVSGFSNAVRQLERVCGPLPN